MAVSFWLLLVVIKRYVNPTTTRKALRTPLKQTPSSSSHTCPRAQAGGAERGAARYAEFGESPFSLRSPALLPFHSPHRTCPSKHSLHPSLYCLPPSLPPFLPARCRRSTSPLGQAHPVFSFVKLIMPTNDDPAAVTPSLPLAYGVLTLEYR